MWENCKVTNFNTDTYAFEESCYQVSYFPGRGIVKGEPYATNSDVTGHVAHDCRKLETAKQLVAQNSFDVDEFYNELPSYRWIDAGCWSAEHKIIQHVLQNSSMTDEQRNKLNNLEAQPIEDLAWVKRLELMSQNPKIMLPAISAVIFLGFVIL